MNRYQEIELDGRKRLSVEVESLIRKGEDTLGVDHANLVSMDGEQLVVYLTDLRRKYQQRVKTENSADAAESQEPPPKVNEAIASLKAVPVIPEVEAQEKELDELLDQLRKVNRHWKIERAKRQGVPMKALLHAASLWLSGDPDDWTAANDTIFQFTSKFGNKQLCYRRSKKVAIPNI
jgi:hypothetical protein